ncbi:hypothetical protein F5B21DRAFT_459407 [Xylaria acuta]|nr:hypothetical protein F5B21DRAFT_459407 [Xylaria acuta]
MAMLPDASKPRDQWPVEWHCPRHNNHIGHVNEGVRRDDAGVVEMGGTKDKTVKDQLADGVLKIATGG